MQLKRKSVPLRSRHDHVIFSLRFVLNNHLIRSPLIKLGAKRDAIRLFIIVYTNEAILH